MQNTEPPVDPDLQKLAKLSEYLDNKFALGGVRFGLDPIIGLIPIAGDVAGLMVNSVMLRTMYRKGASPWIMLKMLGNQLADIAVGLVPFLGDLLDMAHKAHRRNLKLLQAYYADPEPKPSVLWAMILFVVVFLGLLVGGFLAAKWIWGLIF
jgi:hypothetical protein